MAEVHDVPGTPRHLGEEIFYRSLDDDGLAAKDGRVQVPLDGTARKSIKGVFE
jgi:hypothetical protein